MTFDEINAQDDHATIEVDVHGFIVAIRNGFTSLLGWDQSVVGQPLATIIPNHMHDAHHMGFSRFVTTGEPRLLESDVELPTKHASGDLIPCVHHIAARKLESGEWRIISMIRPA